MTTDTLLGSEQTNTDADQSGTAGQGGEDSSATGNQDTGTGDAGSQDVGGQDNQNSDGNSDSAGKDGGESGKGGDGNDGESKGAPESYTDYALPEGFTLSDERASTFNELAKANDWSQKDAQGVIDLYTKMTQEDTEQQTQAANDAFAKQQEDWVSELKADKDFGGADFDKNVGLAVKVVERFGGEEIDQLKKLMFDTGMGNNPIFIKMFNRIGKVISEDVLSGSDTQEGDGKTEKSAADILYGTKQE